MGYPLGFLRSEVFEDRSSPNHPHTQGKIERFHQTLKLHLAQKPRTTSVAMLQKQLNYFRGRCNNDGPHKARNGNIPAFAYLKTPKASPQDSSNFDGIRHRIDKVDLTGKVSLRRAGRMHHPGVGRAHIGISVILLTTKTYASVINPATEEHLS